MDITNIIAIVIIIILFSIVIIMFFYCGDDISKLVDVLKKETIVLFPIVMIMLIYQVYKSGHWKLSEATNCYILVIYYIVNIFIILEYKLLKGRRYNKYKYSGALCMSIVFTPIITITFLIVMVLGLK